MHSLTTTSAKSAVAPCTLIAGTAPDSLDTAVADTTGVTLGPDGAGETPAGLGGALGGAAGEGSGVAGRAAGGVGAGGAAGASGSALPVVAGSAAPEAGSESRCATRERAPGCFLRSTRSAAFDGAMADGAAGGAAAAG